jgi:hypothetical protein
MTRRRRDQADDAVVGFRRGLLELGENLDFDPCVAVAVARQDTPEPHLSHQSA